MKVGVISDTHGLLRPEAIAALQGCAQIIHAGDIGSQDIVEQLTAIAPLHIVRGNNDMDADWAKPIADHLRFDIDGWQVLLVHDIADVPALLDDSVKLIVTGHSHKPLIDWRGDTLYLNPGSAGRRRFKLPVTLAVIEVSPDAIEPSLVQLVD
ncbi:metallophosphatase family protein [Pseudomonas syringae pv. syringae]|uniref:metallophosphoesterase family protein n=1 Tax=Pseudomonas TaxID=286 RepID=UPI0006B97085|nr:MULTISPECIES: metallophosphoesterase family protein [Pseudomonas]KPB28139.1 putative metallophosphatase [Pseudomonas syringae pv. syringae]MCK9712696.1 metallophosphatase family protein [Pseudomonas syringae pv. syringae]MCK9742396.1 metallophosphatase family protein [Pseudomonas syringae pv. syringae]MCK9765357.1 metallophosphatase family protein [Pseudomonas syringae pv. syringae]MDA7014223.1 metallophosphoesterase family protein [Pseudomonas cerasi]